MKLVETKCFFKFNNPFKLCQLEDNEIIPLLDRYDIDLKNAHYL